MPSQKPQAPAQKTVSRSTSTRPLPTFLDHVHELRRRLFWVVGSVLVVSSVAYSFLGTIIDVLTRPLGSQQLFYLTPAGGLSFSFKLCAYVGILIAVPLIMYHLYRFLEPLMGKWRKSAFFYLSFSSLLACAGALFAYYVSLPAALRFLTGFNIDHIQAMLTADSYLSFVITYLLGAALLFQIPLLLLIINTMTPLKPSKLMRLQRFVIIGAFIIGAIISPTPDIMNQTFLALPIIGMYQLGVMLVWIQNRAVRRRQQTIEQPFTKAIPDDVLQEFARPVTATHTPVVASAKQAVSTATMTRRTVEGAMQSTGVYSDIRFRPQPRVRQTASVSHRPNQAPQLSVPVRNIDGFARYRTPVSASTP